MRKHSLGFRKIDQIEMVVLMLYRVQKSCRTFDSGEESRAESGQEVCKYLG